MIKYFLFALGVHLAVCDYAKYAEFIINQAENDTFVRLFAEHVKLFQDDDSQVKPKAGLEFPCQKFVGPARRSTTVHNLQPTDVKVVGALGDSITAGTGIKAKTVIGLLKQDRGLSWSVGGDKSIVEDETLPNMMKVYNPEVRGFSKGWGPVWLESVSHLNLANPGDVSEDIPAQAVKLVDRMKADKTINFQEDWKVITLFIGGNDLCSYCEDKSKYSAESYVANIKTALDYLHANVPRTFVNLVQILDVAMVKNLNAGFICSTLHRFLCDCAAFPANAEAEAELVAETQRYRDLTQALVDTGRYDTRDDFTVIVQPFFTATSPPLKAGTNEIDLSYFSPDCFHLSEKGHRAAADGLWNNMIEPVAAKRRSWTPGELVECPSSAHPYFYTYKNSNTAQAQRSANGNFAAKLNTQTGNTHNTKTGSSSTSAATVSIVAVAMVCIVLALVGALVWRRVKKSERIVLWRQPGSEYNKI